MAALVYCVCSALNDLYVFSNAYRRCNYNFTQTIKYLKYKERLNLFYKYCCDFRENYYRSTNCVKLRSLDNHQEKLPEKMYKTDRSGIDFAAIEASAEAFEVIDSFAAKTPHESVENFLDAERINTNFRENYYEEDIEIINGIEAEYEVSKNLIFTYTYIDI